MSEFMVREVMQDEMPKERLLKWGARMLSERELLAVILGTGNNKESVHDLSQRILEETGGLAGLRRASGSWLKRISGLGQVKLSRVLAAFELANRVNENTAKTAVSSPQQAYKAIVADLIRKDVEELWVLILNTKNVLIEKVMVSRGGLNFAAAHPREVFREAILRNGGAIILAHNHPSGDPNPSANDKKLTDVLVKCGKLLGIPLLDHIVIGNGSYVSLKEKGEMK